MAETGLWVMTRHNIFGISLGKLVELGKMAKVEDWESTPKEMTPSFNVHEELPEMLMRAFFLDDKVFLAGGLIDRPSIWEDPSESSNFYQLLFEDDVNDSSKVFRIKISEARDSIPPPPTLVSNCFIANIGGHVYLLLHDGTGRPIELGLWVLSDDRKEWKPLPDPPPLYAHECADNWSCFVLQDKLFMVIRDRPKIFMYVFGTRTLEWTKVEDKAIDSFALWRSGIACFPSTTVSSLPDVCNCCVALTYSLDSVPSEFHVRVKIDAMLVNKQDHSVFRCQSLDDCFKAILPPSFDIFSLRVNFVELGKGVVCVLVNGDVPLSDPALWKDGAVGESNTVLCIVVFALSLAQELDIEAPGKNQRFLSVDDVYVSQVFTLKGHKKGRQPEELQDAFIFPPPRDAGIGHLLQRRTPRSDSDSASSISRNPASNTPKDRSPKAVEHKLPTSPLLDENRPSRVQELESQIAQLQEDLKIAKDQLKEAKETKKQLLDMMKP